MADIFLSYASQDRERIKTLVEALERQGYSLFWDRTIAPGQIFDQVIEQALDVAKCVVVVWSRHSVMSEWVKSEADEGVGRQILVPVLIDDVRIPLAFRRIQAVRLVDWQGESRHPEIELLFNTIRGIVKPVTEEKQDKAETRSTGQEKSGGGVLVEETAPNVEATPVPPPFKPVPVHTLPTALTPPEQMPSESSPTARSRPFLPERVRIILWFAVAVAISLLNHFTLEALYQSVLSDYDYSRRPAELFQEFYQQRPMAVSFYLSSVIITTLILPVSVVLRRSRPSNSFLRAMEFVGVVMCLYWAAIPLLVRAGALKYTHSDPIELAQLSTGIFGGAAILSPLYIRLTGRKPRAHESP